MIRQLIALFMIFTLLGCSINSNTDVQSTNEELTGNRPPKAVIKIGEELYQTKLGTFCWTYCADTMGPEDSLRNEKPVAVQPGAVIRFVMDYKPLPNMFLVEQYTKGRRTVIEVKDNTFQAPTEKGTYYYSYGAWWMVDKESNVSRGDASYHFALEII